MGSRAGSTYVALLRAVNVGGTKTVGMAALRALLERLGYGEVRTLLQSGNVVFSGGRRSTGALEAELERAIRDAFRVETDVVVRDAAHVAQVVARNPFAREARSDPGHLLVLFPKSPPAAAAVKALAAAIAGRESVQLAGGHLYVVYPDGIGRSKLTNSVIEKHLGTRGTARNWNTVLKLAEATGG